MGNKLDWKSIPGIVGGVIEELAMLPVKSAQALFDELQNNNELAKKISAGVSTRRGDIDTQVPRNINTVETFASDGSVKPTDTSGYSERTGPPVSQRGATGQTEGGQIGRSGTSETFASNEGATLASNDQTAISGEEKDTTDYKTMYRNMYGGEYNTDERIQGVFKRKNGFATDSELSEMTFNSLKDKYNAITGDTFTGDEKDLRSQMKEMRDRAIKTYKPSTFADQVPLSQRANPPVFPDLSNY